MKLKLLASAMVLSGCQSVDNMSAEQRQAFVNEKSRECIAKGHKPVSDKHLACVLAAVGQNTATPQMCFYDNTGNPSCYDQSPETQRAIAGAVAQ